MSEPLLTALVTGAEVMVAGTGGTVGKGAMLFDYGQALREQGDRVVLFLAQEVERLSGRRRTVRTGSERLIAHVSSSTRNVTALCVVLCEIHRRPGEVITTIGNNDVAYIILPAGSDKAFGVVFARVS